jgi:hypothetical protein
VNIRGIIFDKETNGGDSGISGISKPDTAPMQRVSSSKVGAGGLITSSEKTGRSFEDMLPQTA